jgi:uncharacterized protein YndB with AHSA1/START domain
MKTIELELTRTIPASASEVFDGWLDPTCPGTPWSVAAKLVLDPQVDGLFYWLFINEAGERKPHYGRFTLLDRPSKVQYTWMSLHTRGLESLVTVTFQKKGEDTHCDQVVQMPGQCQQAGHPRDARAGRGGRRPVAAEAEGLGRPTAHTVAVDLIRDGPWLCR